MSYIYVHKEWVLYHGGHHIACKVAQSGHFRPLWDLPRAEAVDPTHWSFNTT